MVYIVIGKFGWGKGTNGRAALTQMRQNVASADRNSYVLYAVQDKDAMVNHAGNIVAKAEPVEIERRNWPNG